MRTKLRWSQTPEGRKRLSKLMRERHAARKRALVEVEVPVTGSALADVRTTDDAETETVVRTGFAVYGQVERLLVEASRKEGVPRHRLTKAMSQLLQDSAETL